MNRDYYSHPWQQRDASDLGPNRYGTNRPSRRGNPSRYDDNASSWNDAQTARWLSHYGGAAERGERDEGNQADYDRNEYAQGYGTHRSNENPRYGQRFQESWEGYSPDEAWRQRGAERVSPGSHGRYGWRGEESDPGSLNFQPGERGYGSTYGPTFGSTYRHSERDYENYRGDYGGLKGGSWDDSNWSHAGERAGAYFGRGPSGYTRSDERIREDVCDRLTDDPRVDASAIQVTVEAGVVTLQGQVPDRQMKHRAEDCAEHVSGVKDVENRVRVSRGEGWNEESEGGSSSLRDK